MPSSSACADTLDNGLSVVAFGQVARHHAIWDEGGDNAILPLTLRSSRRERSEAGHERVEPHVECGVMLGCGLSIHFGRTPVS